jgi:hypothetical protein
MPDRIKKFVPASAAVLQAIYEASINTRRDESGAAPTTLEAAMYSLRERGERAWRSQIASADSLKCRPRKSTKSLRV